MLVLWASVVARWFQRGFVSCLPSPEEKASPRGLLVATRTRFLGECRTEDRQELSIEALLLNIEQPVQQNQCLYQWGQKQGQAEKATTRFSWAWWA